MITKIIKKRYLVNIDNLMKDIIDGEENKIDIFFESILDCWLYFFFNEKNGKDTKPGKGNVEVVLFTGKDNPILVPLVENEKGRNAILYTNSELAQRSVEFNCKIGKMKGRNALKMFHELTNVDSVFIQGNYGYIHPTRKELANMVK